MGLASEPKPVRPQGLEPWTHGIKNNQIVRIEENVLYVLGWGQVEQATSFESMLHDAKVI